MLRHKAWRGGSNAQQSCVPATALSSASVFFTRKERQLAKISQNCSQNYAQTHPKTSNMERSGAKLEPKWRQDGSRWRRTRKNKRQHNRIREGALNPVAPFWQKMVPTWAQLGSPNGANMVQTSTNKSNILPFLGFGLSRGHVLCKSKASLIVTWLGCHT